jgi:N-acetylneuraminate synthase
MANAVKIGSKFVGPGLPNFLVAEIGINHNGDIDTAKRLIDAAVDAGFDAVKFQKRTLEIVYTPEELARPRPNEFGETNGDLKRGLEFGIAQYTEIDLYCKGRGIMWFASCWDEPSVDFMEQFDLPAYKIASASLTDDNLLQYHRKFGRPIIMSTGMSTMDQIDHAVDVVGRDNLVLLHCTSTYPSKSEELNLKTIQTLIDRYDIPIGYSGHEVGLVTSVAAVALGAQMVERHITLDRAMWGSDQAASVEPAGFDRLARYIRAVESALGDGQKRVYDSELPILEKLRRVG